MRANVQRMDHRRDEVVGALKQARDLIVARGYQPHYGSTDDGGPINISNALTGACGDYELYLLARQCFSRNWGGPVPGLLNWETEKRRTVSEVVDLFAKVLAKWEKNEVHPTGLDRRRLGGSRPRST